MQGDCYSLLIEPGYDRNGLAFLRGSVKSEGYFLGKCPFNSDLLTEVKYDTALENFNSEHVGGSLTDEELEQITEELNADGGIYTEASYYELCSEYNIDEPSSPRVLTSRTKLQLAGLQCFVEAYDKMFYNPEIKVCETL